MTNCKCPCPLSRHHFSSHAVGNQIVNWLMCHDCVECRVELGDVAAAQAFLAAEGVTLHAT
jgi:hypothetical protein